ncbi:MAG TPA: hypothetical protein VGK89_03180 [Candidatus Eisenbacteria bacterium]|jgi:hypothetical protein
MHLASRPSVLRRIATRLALAAVVLASAIVLTQCQLVQDNLMGVKVEPEKNRSCLRDCRETLEDAMEAEDQLHDHNQEACEELDDHDARRTCRAEERERHRNAAQGIRDAFRACVNDCHHQGGGRGR